MRVELSKDVMVRHLEGEAVLLDLGSQRYFGLDEVGSRIWDLLAEGRALAEVVDALAAEYEVERARLEGDVTELVERLEAAGLARRAEEEERSAP